MHKYYFQILNEKHFKSLCPFCLCHMTSSRHHIAILFDPFIGDATSHSIKLKKASYELQFKRSFLSHIVDAIAEYMRIIFDLHPGFITFDIISCGQKIHPQTSITKSDYVRCIERFQWINGVSGCNETKFVECIENYLLELPSDFYNSHRYSSPFSSHQTPPATHIIFIARNQPGIANWRYCINTETNTQINFSNLCKTAKVRNHSIERVYILKFDNIKSGDSKVEPRPWTETTDAAYTSNADTAESPNDDGDDGDDDEENDPEDEDSEMNEMNDPKSEKSVSPKSKKTKSMKSSQIAIADRIRFFESVTDIESLHQSLLSVLCDFQFPATIRKLDIVSVPFKDPGTGVKTALSIPMVCCIDNIGHHHLYRTELFMGHDVENREQFDDIETLQWSKVPDLDKVDCGHWITSNVALITPSKLDDTSRLLMKFINKKKMATLRANYTAQSAHKYYRKRWDGKWRITHAIKVIGMQLYLISVMDTKDIKGYNTTINTVNANNKEALSKDERFPFDRYCLQRHLLPDSNPLKREEVPHGLQHWIQSDNISKVLSDIKPPFVNPENKCCLMQIPKRGGEEKESGNGERFGGGKTYMSSTHLDMVTKQLEANAVGLIGKGSIARKIEADLEAMNGSNGIQQERSLFDMMTKM